MLLRCAIVEDIRLDAETLTRRLLAAAEHTCQLQCTQFPDGGAFLRAAQTQRFDAVFLDICMPGLSGIETARRLRGQSAKLPIVFVTSSEEAVWDALPLHPFDYLRKPYDERRVHALLDDLLAVLGRPEPELELRVARQTCVPIQQSLCADPRLLLCNRGVVVNMDKVLRFESDAIQMLNGMSFPVRQKDKGRLFAAFTQYQFRHMRREL